MTGNWKRRDVLQSALAGGSFLSSGIWRTLNLLAAENQIGTAGNAEIENLAERIMQSDPKDVVHLIVEELKSGLSRQEFLAACLNAGMRFHGHHSAYVAHPVRFVSDTISSVAGLLPLFYYLSVLRNRAARPALRWLDTTKAPHPLKAEERFHSAMQSGERDDAGLAMITMSRSFGAHQAFRHLQMYAAERNHNSGGHTAVSVVNTLRALQATDWQCAESALQFAVTDEAWRTPGGSEICKVNRVRASRIPELPATWSSLGSAVNQVRELVDLYRTGDSENSCRETFDLLRRNSISSGAVWDALFLTTAEMVVRYRFVGGKRLAGHSITCVNALHYLFRTAFDSETRLYCLLEAVEWTTSFLARERARPALRDFDLLSLTPAEIPPDAIDGLDEIFGLLPPRRFAAMHRPGFENVDDAMRKTLAWAQQHSNDDLFRQRAMWLMCIKSTPEVHDFKYPMALFENSANASATWRPLLIAAAVHVLHGTNMEDSQIVREARDRLG